MGKGRLEAFTDAVLAIIMTLMVIELKVPHGIELAALSDLLPGFLSYVLSFIYLGIYWNNHHHMLSVTHQASGRILWPTYTCVLAVIDSFRQWLDGRKSICASPDSAVWGDSAARRLRVFAAPA